MDRRRCRGEGNGFYDVTTITTTATNQMTRRYEDKERKEGKKKDPKRKKKMEEANGTTRHHTIMMMMIMLCSECGSLLFSWSFCHTYFNIVSFFGGIDADGDLTVNLLVFFILSCAFKIIGFYRFSITLPVTLVRHHRLNVCEPRSFELFENDESIRWRKYWLMFFLLAAS